MVIDIANEEINNLVKRRVEIYIGVFDHAEKRQKIKKETIKLLAGKYYENCYVRTNHTKFVLMACMS